MNLAESDYQVYWLEKHRLLAVWAKSSSAKPRHETKVWALVSEDEADCLGVLRQGRGFALLPLPAEWLDSGRNADPHGIELTRVGKTGELDTLLRVELQRGLAAGRGKAATGVLAYGVVEEKGRLGHFIYKGEGRVAEAEGKAAAGGGLRAWAREDTREDKMVIGPASEPGMGGSGSSEAAVDVDFSLVLSTDPTGKTVCEGLRLVTKTLPREAELRLWRYHPQVERVPTSLTLYDQEKSGEAWQQPATNVQLELTLPQGGCGPYIPGRAGSGRVWQLDEMDMFMPEVVTQDERVLPCRIKLDGRAVPDSVAVRLVDGLLVTVSRESPSYKKAAPMMVQERLRKQAVGESETRQVASLTPEYMFQERPPEVKDAVNQVQGALLKLEEQHESLARHLAIDIEFLVALSRVPGVFRSLVLDDVVRVDGSGVTAALLDRVLAIFPRHPVLLSVVADHPTLAAAAVKFCEAQTGLSVFGLHTWLQHILPSATETRQTVARLSSEELVRMLEAVECQGVRPALVVRCLGRGVVPKEAFMVEEIAGYLAEIAEVEAAASAAGDEGFVGWIADYFFSTTKNLDNSLVVGPVTADEVRHQRTQIRQAWQGQKQRLAESAAEAEAAELAAKREAGQRAFLTEVDAFLTRSSQQLLGGRTAAGWLERLNLAEDIAEAARSHAGGFERWPACVTEVAGVRERQTKLQQEVEKLDSLRQAAVRDDDPERARIDATLKALRPAPVLLGLAVAAAEPRVHEWLAATLTAYSELDRSHHRPEVISAAGILRSGLGQARPGGTFAPDVLRAAEHLLQLCSQVHQQADEADEVRGFLQVVAQQWGLPLALAGQTLGQALAAWASAAGDKLRSEVEALHGNASAQATRFGGQSRVANSLRSLADWMAEWQAAAMSAAAYPKPSAKMMAAVIDRWHEARDKALADLAAEPVPAIITAPAPVVAPPPEPPPPPAQPTASLSIIPPTTPRVAPSLATTASVTPASGAGGQVAAVLAERARWVTGPEALCPQALAKTLVHGMGLSSDDGGCYEEAQKLFDWAERAGTVADEDSATALLAELLRFDDAALLNAGNLMKRRYDELRKTLNRAVKQTPLTTDLVLPAWWKDWSLEEVLRADKALREHNQGGSLT